MKPLFYWSYNDATQMYYYGARYGVYAERSRSNPRSSIFVSVDFLRKTVQTELCYQYEHMDYDGEDLLSVAPISIAKKLISKIN